MYIKGKHKIAVNWPLKLAYKISLCPQISLCTFVYGPLCTFVTAKHTIALTPARSAMLLPISKTEIQQESTLLFWGSVVLNSADIYNCETYSCPYACPFCNVIAHLKDRNTTKICRFLGGVRKKGWSTSYLEKCLRVFLPSQRDI